MERVDEGREGRNTHTRRRGVDDERKKNSYTDKAKRDKMNRERDRKECALLSHPKPLGYWRGQEGVGAIPCRKVP